MGFEKGNQYWKLADPDFVGAPRIFETPKDLWEAVRPYFEWIDENPTITVQTTSSAKGTFTNVNELQRPYTWRGLFAFLGICNLERYKEKDEFAKTITHIENIIISQKFEGAASGIFNASIIGKDLGLVDKKDHTSNGKELNLTPVYIERNKDK